MRWLLAVVFGLAVIASLPVASANAGIQASFAPPVQFQGEAIVTASWAILEFQAGHGSSILDASIDSLAKYTYQNYTWITNSNDYGYSEVPVPFDDSGRRSGQLTGFQANWNNWGYVGIQADSIQLLSKDLSATVLALPVVDQTALDNPPPGGNDDAVSTWAAESDENQVYGEMVNPKSLQLTITGLRAIELLGGDVSCSSDSCPTGGDTSRQSLGGVIVEQWSFERITGLSGSAQMSASPVRVRIGGPSLDVHADGAIRLPKATLAGKCECPTDPDSTLTLQGEFALTGLSPGPDGRMNTVLSGERVQAFSDEQPIIIPALARNAVAAGAGLATIAIVVKIALGLFTRLSKHEALEHPKRQRIFHYIQEHPGANFREVARNTSIAAGTVRHHLTVLERAGHVVEHPHQGTVRLFENHGKFDHNWSDLVLLREPPLAKLHAWLKEHPQSPQKAALEAMELEGWSRSTTQHRLSRLVEGGVATIRLQGRLKIYNVVDRQAPKPLLHPMALRPAFAT